MKTDFKDQSKMVELSIVTTMYRSAAFINEFHKLSSEVAAGLTSSYEIIFVNDGSPDDSLNIACALVEADPHVRVIDLSRNFGHHRAIMVGLEHSRGQKVFLIDSDLEEDPLSLTEFFAEMMRTNAEVVYGVQKTRKGNLIRNLGGAWFWSFFNIISEVKVTPNMITSRLMSRRYIDALLRFRERDLFLAGIFALVGFKQIPLTVKKGVREGTTYTVRKRFALLVNATTSFSNRPLVLVFYFGLAISLASGIAAAILIARTLFYGDYLIGWPSVIVSIWLLAGITIFCIGLIGIYLAKVFQEVKERPLSIIREFYEHPIQNKSSSSEVLDFLKK
jgi:putative glycosyltransferase